MHEFVSIDNKGVRTKWSPEGAITPLGTSSSPYLKTCKTPATFNELRFFSPNLKTLPYIDGQRFSRIKYSSGITSISTYTATWVSGQVLDFPPTLTSLLATGGGGFWIRLTGSDKTVIFRSATPPSVTSSYQTAANMNKIKAIYIPSEYMDAYKAHAQWGNATLVAKMQPLEGSKYEEFNEWEYDD